MYGIAGTIVGYLASSIGGRIDTEHPLARFGLIFIFFHFHQAILVITHRVLLVQPERFFSLSLLLDSVVTSAFGVFLFAMLDRLRRPN
jgi:rod shape-determining protein MreD